MPKGRPGGNPAIQEYKFDAKYDYGNETCSEKLTLRMPPSLKAKLKAGIVPDWQEVARRALLDAIARTEQPPATPGATELEQGELTGTGEEEPARTTRKRAKAPAGRGSARLQKNSRRNTQTDSEG
jgi:hypothetical protein